MPPRRGVATELAAALLQLGGRGSPESHVELEALSVFGLDLLRGAQATELAIDLNRDARTQCLRLLHGVCRQDDDALLAFLGDVLDHRPHAPSCDRVHASGGLVEEDHRRLANSRHGHGQFPLVAAAQLARPRPDIGREVQIPHRVADSRRQSAPGQALQPAVQVQVLLSGEAVQQRVELRAITNQLASLCSLCAHVVALDAHLAARRRDLSAQHLEGRGLARAVHTEEAEDLTLLRGEGDAPHGVPAAPVDLVNVVHIHELLHLVNLIHATLLGQHHLVLRARRRRGIPAVAAEHLLEPREARDDVEGDRQHDVDKATEDEGEELVADHVVAHLVLIRGLHTRRALRRAHAQARECTNACVGGRLLPAADDQVAVAQREDGHEAEDPAQRHLRGPGTGDEVQDGDRDRSQDAEEHIEDPGDEQCNPRLAEHEREEVGEARHRRQEDDEQSHRGVDTGRLRVGVDAEDAEDDPSTDRGDKTPQGVEDEV
mmetsp:Transcript_112366/g.357104  ORF Transcript_112366/g.357104 Transcript_112366/m.357104 type:complete len:489 (-) Transcript_112366:4137-5603(-)